MQLLDPVGIVSTLRSEAATSSSVMK